MKLGSGYLIYVVTPGKGIHKIIEKLAKCEFSRSTMFITKPSVVQVQTRSGRMFNIVIPPASLAVDPEVARDCNLELGDYVVARDSWVDGKVVPTRDSIAGYGKRCLLIESLERVFGTFEERGRCYIVCEKDVGELIKNLQNPSVSDLSTLDDLSGEFVEGVLRSAWPHHPILYGLRLANKVSLNIVNIRGTSLKYYTKPIAYLDSKELIYEVPYSNSILFTGYTDELLEVAVRSVLYIC